MRKRYSNEDAVKFLRTYIEQRDGLANCMWTRQVMREAGFTNGQIRCAVTKLKLKPCRNQQKASWARTYDAWEL